MDPREFFDELKRRNVFTGAVAYAVGGWALAEGISQVFPVFDIPDSVVRLIVLFIVLGFPVALVLSWFFDLTRYGIVRTPDRAPEAKIDIVGPSNLAEKSIAVLPFENLSEEKANAYFASGMGDEVLTKLAQLAELKVISRASTERYQSHPDDLRGVGRQLGVATVLAGSVQKAGDEVLISVQLIDVRTGNQLWAQGYRRTLKNIFEVEAEVAEKVAEALKVKLVRAEAQRLATPATTNPRAHDLYLRAHALGTHSDEQSLEQTITLLRQALIEDPHFALAWGDLAWAYLSIVDAYRAPLEILTPAEHAALMAVANDEHAGAGHTYFGAIALILTAIFRWRNASWNVVSPSILIRPMLTAGMPGISRAWKEISLPRAPNGNGPKRSTRSTLGQPGPHRLSPLLRAITKRPSSSRNASSRSIRISYTTRIRSRTFTSRSGAGKMG